MKATDRMRPCAPQSPRAADCAISPQQRPLRMHHTPFCPNLARKALVIALMLMGAAGARGQDTLGGRAVLRVEGSHFFLNRESGAEKVDGYTLPGFYLRPTVTWNATSRFSLTGGLHWLHYWGAQRYPAVGSFEVLPAWSDTTSRLHLLPWMQAKADLGGGLELTLGSLDASNHGLPLPLYNPDHRFGSDPEAGAELTLHRQRLEADMWVDWRELIFRQSPFSERFTGGLTAAARLLDRAGWGLETMGYMVVRHTGGESATTLERVHSDYNFGLGLRVDYRWGQGKNRLCAESDLLGYYQRGNPDVPFTSGKALFASLAWHYNPSAKHGVVIHASWYRSEQFVPQLGSWHYGNLSATTSHLHFDASDVITLQGSYRMAQTSWASVNAVARWYHYLPYTGDRDEPEYPEKVVRGHADSFDIGIFIDFSPQFTLHP